MENDLFKHSSLLIGYFAVFLLMFFTLILVAWKLRLEIDQEVVGSALLGGVKPANSVLALLLTAMLSQQNQQEWVAVAGIIALSSIFITFYGVRRTLVLFLGRSKAKSK